MEKTRKETSEISICVQNDEDILPLESSWSHQTREMDRSENRWIIQFFFNNSTGVFKTLTVLSIIPGFFFQFRRTAFINSRMARAFSFQSHRFWIPDYGFGFAIRWRMFRGMQTSSKCSKSWYSKCKN